MSFLVNPYVYRTSLCPDPDVNAFITATGITNTIIIGAVCTLVTSMKANGTWAKMSAIYPMVGGTATTHKFNLKNPADTNAAFRLSFVGGWTHSANGALPNGTNAYAETFCLHTQLNSSSMSFYSRTNSMGLFNDIGNATNSNPNSILVPRFLDSFFGHINQDINASALNPDSIGLFIVSRTASNVLTLFKNASLFLSSTVVSTSIPTNTLIISAWKQSAVTISRYSNRQCAFVTIGNGLTNAESLALYNSIQAFQTTLGRQV